MPAEKIIESLFEQPTKRFQHHLNIIGNERILFSGRFGIGKTTFLKHFFTQNEDKFNTIHLFPVNYSLLENEDIFSYIKYDILISLFSASSYPNKPDYYSFLESLDSFLLKNLNQVLATTVLLIPKLGKQLSDFIKEVKEMSIAFKAARKPKINKELDDINKFLMQFHEAEGGIYESNVITLLIQEWLRNIKLSGKENVLIIDDLDRIDPSHIFRLLNVFSAHFDSKDDQEFRNKFGFSRVIFVCDVRNISNIYQQQYGAKTDFNGYVDKFYSKAIFRFDNKNTVVTIITQIVGSINLKLFTEYDEPVDISKDIDRRRKTINQVLQPLVTADKLSLRSLFKYYKEELVIPHLFYDVYGVNFLIGENYLLSALYTIAMMFGDFELLKDKILELDIIDISHSDHIALFIGELVLLNDINNTFNKMNSLYHGGIIADLPVEIKIKNGKKYEGNYGIYVEGANSTCKTGVLGKLLVDEVEIDVIKNDFLDIADLVHEVTSNIKD